MKQSIKLLAMSFLAIICLTTAEAQSPPAKAEGKIGDVSVMINYHSPRVKGRTIYGGLEKWNAVWRAGANNATTIEFSSDVKVNGKKLAKGKYAFFIIPKEDKDWTLIFNTVPDQWGAYKYDESKDALRVDVKAEKIDNKEELEYMIEGSNVSMAWADRKVSFKVTK